MNEGRWLILAETRDDTLACSRIIEVITSSPRTPPSGIPRSEWITSHPRPSPPRVREVTRFTCDRRTKRGGLQ